METDSPSRALATPSAGTAFIFCQNKCTGEYFHLLSSKLKHCRMFWFCCSLCFPSPLSSMLLITNNLHWEYWDTRRVIVNHELIENVHLDWERLGHQESVCYGDRLPNHDPTLVRSAVSWDQICHLYIAIYRYIYIAIFLGNIHNMFIQPVQETFLNGTFIGINTI